MTSHGSLFDSNELARWSKSSRPPAPQAAPRVTVVCSCGVLMEVTWARASVVRCFGCGLAFNPPPGAAPRVAWKPELARDPLAPPPEPAPTPRTRTLARTLAPWALVPLLVALGALVVLAAL